MHETAVSELLQIIIPDIVACLCPAAADEEPQTVLRIAVDLPQAFNGIDDRKIPQAP